MTAMAMLDEAAREIDDILMEDDLMVRRLSSDRESDRASAHAAAGRLKLGGRPDAFIIRRARPFGS